MPRFRRPRSPVHTARRAAAVLLGLLALVLALRPGPPATGAMAPPTVPATVATTDLAAGAVLTGADLTVARFPAGLVPSGVVADPGTLVGRVLAGAVRAGEPVTDVRLVGPGLTAALPEGQVAAPVRLADLGVAGLVHTGDRVDVLATPPDAAVAEVVAGSALVLATPRPGAEGGSPAGGLLVLAVDQGTAARLAATSASATLTVSLPAR
ncbi:Flp pilus assembly protein CpaB [Blastococcus deserti]|uniref:Flp pilus assembly protein CpaB n=1 Tax=Blastococcus deserti TaxID=2259033 RepID=A0ABW4XAC3_9ACTN